MENEIQNPKTAGLQFRRFRWEFPKVRSTILGVLIIRILQFRVLY